jgi:hypothetical protein
MCVKCWQDAKPITPGFVAMRDGTCCINRSFCVNVQLAEIAEYYGSFDLPADIVFPPCLWVLIHYQV